MNYIPYEGVIAKLHKTTKEFIYEYLQDLMGLTADEKIISHISRSAIEHMLDTPVTPLWSHQFMLAIVCIIDQELNHNPQNFKQTN